MKCTSCGYNLGIEDNWCPHCGRQNMQAAMHNMDMMRYNREFEETLDEVKSNAKKFNVLAVKITIVAVLVALIAVTIVAIINSYEIKAERLKKSIHKNLAKHERMLDGYIADRDPVGFRIYYDKNRIIYGDRKDVGKYNTVEQIGRNYCRIYEYTVRLQDESQESSYYTEEQCIEQIQHSISYIKQYDVRTDYNKQEFDEGRGEYIDYLVKLTEDTLQVYFKLTDEEVVEMWDMNPGRFYMLLEEGLDR